MKSPKILMTMICIATPMWLTAQKIDLQKSGTDPVGVNVSPQKEGGESALKVTKDPTNQVANAPAFAKLKNVTFKDGTIEVKLLSKLLPDAGETARGFIGIAFRIDQTNTNFECIYIRPTNGRADDQVRRNHSIQYVSHPDFDFQRLRKESPEKYESYADMGLNEWIILKIVVKGAQARLYLNNNKQPSLIVNDLKHGPDQAGGIGLFVDNGTEGYFAQVNISN
jgi:hypothetical protein